MEWMQLEFLMARLQPVSVSYNLCSYDFVTADFSSEGGTTYRFVVFVP